MRLISLNPKLAIGLFIAAISFMLFLPNMGVTRSLLFGDRVHAIVYARHVEDPGAPGGVNLWGESPLFMNPVTD
jgi:hypothetical protein